MIAPLAVWDSLGISWDSLTDPGDLWDTGAVLAGDTLGVSLAETIAPCFVLLARAEAIAVELGETVESFIGILSDRADTLLVGIGSSPVISAVVTAQDVLHMTLDEGFQRCITDWLDNPPASGDWLQDPAAASTWVRDPAAGAAWAKVPPLPREREGCSS